MSGNRKYTLGNMEILDKPSTEIAAKILNKKYVEIRIADHRIYKLLGTSIFIKSENEMGYSEANAGSGEIAVIQLIRKIQQAKEGALVLLDEPEVSLHPAAQKKMKEYLLDQIKKKKLQVVVSTHSFPFIEGLPNEAIKLFKTDKSGKFYVLDGVNYQEAFFDIEERALKKKQIYCEDLGAYTLINRVLANMGKKEFVEVKFFSGGEEVLLNHYLTAIAMNDDLWNRIYIWADGDKDTGYVFNENGLTVEQANSLEYLKSEIKNVYGIELNSFPDSGKGGLREDQIKADYIQYLKFSTTNMFYFPDKKIPEEIILSSEHVLNNYKHILEKYGEITNKNAKDIMRDISFEDFHDYDNYETTYKQLTAMWCKEDSAYKEEIVKSLLQIYES